MLIFLGEFFLFLGLCFVRLEGRGEKGGVFALFLVSCVLVFCVGQ